MCCPSAMEKEMSLKAFADIRINRSCAIVTDEDVQIVEGTSSFYKMQAQKRGEINRTEANYYIVRR